MQGRVENLVAKVLYSFLAGTRAVVTQDPKFGLLLESHDSYWFVRG